LNFFFSKWEQERPSLYIVEIELTAILDNCPRMETLDMLDRYNIQLDEDKALQAKCDRIDTEDI
jgi:hypothetical protein